MQEVTIGPNQAGQRLDKFLHKYLPHAGSSFLYKMLRKKNITLNGKKAEGKEILTEKDKIQCYFSTETFEKFSGSKLDNTVSDKFFETSSHFTEEYLNAYHNKELQGIQILYVDSDVMILNKPVGVLTQKAKENDYSLNEWMIGYLLEKKVFTPEELKLFKPSVCNRLDRNTSGIVLCGISLVGSQTLNRFIKNREIKKYYRTIVKGIVKEGASIEGCLTKNHSTNTVKISNNGSEIKTYYEPIELLKNELTYLEVDLITGKTHQIRAHMASIGYPLIGDVKYGNKKCNQKVAEKYGLKNQLLHAYRIEFPENIGELTALSGKSFLAPLPKEFQMILEDLR